MPMKPLICFEKNLNWLKDSQDPILDPIKIKFLPFIIFFMVVLTCLVHKLIFPSMNLPEDLPWPEYSSARNPSLCDLGERETPFLVALKKFNSLASSQTKIPMVRSCTYETNVRFDLMKGKKSLHSVHKLRMNDFRIKLHVIPWARFHSTKFERLSISWDVVNVFIFCLASFFLRKCIFLCTFWALQCCLEQLNHMQALWIA